MRRPCRQRSGRAGQQCSSFLAPSATPGAPAALRLGSAGPPGVAFADGARPGRHSTVYGTRVTPSTLCFPSRRPTNPGKRRGRSVRPAAPWPMRRRANQSCNQPPPPRFTRALQPTHASGPRPLSFNPLTAVNRSPLTPVQPLPRTPKTQPAALADAPKLCYDCFGTSSRQRRPLVGTWLAFKLLPEGDTEDTSVSPWGGTRGPRFPPKPPLLPSSLCVPKV